MLIRISSPFPLVIDGLKHSFYSLEDDLSHNYALYVRRKDFEDFLANLQSAYVRYTESCEDESVEPLLLYWSVRRRGMQQFEMGDVSGGISRWWGNQDFAFQVVPDYGWVTYRLQQGYWARYQVCQTFEQVMRLARQSLEEDE